MEDKIFNRLIVLLGICGVVIMFILGNMIHDRVIQNKADKAYEEMREKQGEVNTTEAVIAEDEATKTATDAASNEAVKEETEAMRQPDFTELRKENADIYAWIYIPDTNIDYPVLQHATDNAYYLEHNMDGSKGYPGCVYSEKENSMEFTDFQTILYGHNMRNGTMFHDLKYFLEDEFLAQHPYIYIYTDNATYIYEIFAAYEYGDEHLLYAFQYDTQEDIQQYADEIAKYYVNSEDLELSTESNILTLSTCISDKDDKRLLVQGILVE